jgi:hypothetical protein
MRTAVSVSEPRLVHMFAGDLIGFDKLGAHREAHRI